MQNLPKCDTERHQGSKLCWKMSPLVLLVTDLPHIHVMKTTVSGRHNKAKCNQTRYGYTLNNILSYCGINMFLWVCFLFQNFFHVAIFKFLCVCYYILFKLFLVSSNGWNIKRCLFCFCFVLLCFFSPLFINLIHVHVSSGHLLNGRRCRQLSDKFPVLISEH